MILEAITVAHLATAAATTVLFIDNQAQEVAIQANTKSIVRVVDTLNLTTTALVVIDTKLNSIIAKADKGNKDD